MNFVTLASACNGCISISPFGSLLGILIGITSSAIAIGLNIFVIAAGSKMYKSMIKKNKKKHDEIVFFAKHKLKSIEVLVSKLLFFPQIEFKKWLKE